MRSVPLSEDISPYKDLPKYLLYGVGGVHRKGNPLVHIFDSEVLYDLPINYASISFLDFNGVVVLAGSFETMETAFLEHKIQGASFDLDRRERQLTTLLQNSLPLVFLVPYMPTAHGPYEWPDSSDLF